MMPGKKDFVSVLGADGKSPSTKETTALHAYSEFKVHHDGLKVGFSKFAQLQPKECIIAGGSGTHSSVFLATATNALVQSHFVPYCNDALFWLQLSELGEANLQSIMMHLKLWLSLLASLVVVAMLVVIAMMLLVDRQALAVLDNVQRGGEMSELDDAGTYFDLGPKQVTQVGTYYYLCTRNNNFSNRDQKSKIIVQSNPYSNARVGALGGFVTCKVEIFQNASGAQAITNSPNTPDYTVSAFTWVGPQQFPDVQGSATVQLALSGTGPNVQTNSGGMFVAASSKTAIISVATVLVVIVVLATVVTVSLVVYFRVKKGAWQKFKTAVKNVPKLRRHVAGKV
eukprot:Em0001g1798a